MNTTILHWLGDRVRDLLLQVPLEIVRLLFIALPVLVLIWVVRQPGQQTGSGDTAMRSQTGLKLGAAVALLLQALVYSLL